MTELQKALFNLQDLPYRDFVSRLTPSVDSDRFIGVRTPQLRKLAKEFAKSPEAADFTAQLPHKYYEENNIHAFIIETIKDYSECIAALDRFLPFVDNWATCDMMSPKVFKKHLPELLTEIDRWLKSGETYTVRFAVEMLMNWYLDEHFNEEYPERVAAVKSEEYYVKMMVAWYFATALAKQYEAVLPYLEQNRLEPWTHNKTIQKAIESNRITAEQKAYLRSLKIKK